LPRDPDLPTNKQAADAWQRQRRGSLAALLKVPHYEASGLEVKNGSPESGPQRQAISTAWKLKLGNDWTVPLTELAPAEKAIARTVLLTADGGRASASAEAARLVARGDRVLAVDPLGWGEAKIKAQDPDYLYPLLLAAVGERALGIQAAQLAATARWARARRPLETVLLVAIGPRASLAAIVAAAVEPGAFAAVEVEGALASLKQLIEEDKTVETHPELFAFGLLAEFDVCQLVALCAPCRVTFRQPSDRARRELAPLAAWYSLLGAPFNPLD
jgi:hypothetical protein